MADEPTPKSPWIPRPGDVLAAGRIGREDREYTFLPRRMPATRTEWPGTAGSVGSPWVTIGYELCSRLLGAKAWRSEGGPVVHSMREALEALAQRLDIPDRVLIHPVAISLRNALREQEQSGSAAEPPDGGDGAEPPTPGSLPG